MTTAVEGLSESVQKAVRWAMAAATLRTGISPGPNGLPVEASDLLVGVLLAHPDARGEGRVLLSHFGLTARDVLPPDYPTVTPEQLQRAAHGISPSLQLGSAGTATVILDAARRLASRRRGDVRLYHLLGALLDESSTEARRVLATAFSRVGASLEEVRSSYIRWMETLPEPVQGVAGDRLAEWLQEH